MTIELSKTEFRRLLDLIYVGNWVMNSDREFIERITDYDALESKLFDYCKSLGMERLYAQYNGRTVPSRGFIEGGVHEAILSYEDNAFFEILAEELARRDMGFPAISEDNADEFVSRMDSYIDEFEENGVENIRVTSSS